MMCVLSMNSTPLFIQGCGRFGAGKIENHLIPPQHAAMHQSVEARPRRQRLRCGRTPGVLAPWWPRLTTAFVWSVPRWAWAPSTSVLGPSLACRWAFFSFFDIARICFTLCLIAPFAWFSTCIRMCVLQNMFSPIQVELGQ
jgi:hypothetical protein